MSLGKPTIKLVFMDDDMRDYAINEATKALETSNSEKVWLFLISELIYDPAVVFNRLLIIDIAGGILHEDVVWEEIQVRLALHRRP